MLLENLLINRIEKSFKHNITKPFIVLCFQAVYILSHSVFKKVAV